MGSVQASGQSEKISLAVLRFPQNKGSGSVILLFILRETNGWPDWGQLGSIPGTSVLVFMRSVAQEIPRWESFS